jgi:hypothetical protein
MSPMLEGSSPDPAERHQIIAQLRAEHQALEARLQTLEQQRSLTSAEQLERAELKKRKLHAKDRLARLSR